MAGRPLEVGLGIAGEIDRYEWASCFSSCRFVLVRDTPPELIVRLEVWLSFSLAMSSLPPNLPTCEYYSERL